MRLVRANTPRLHFIFLNLENQRRSERTVTMHPLRSLALLVAEDDANAGIAIGARIPGERRQRYMMNDRLLTFEIRKGVVICNQPAFVTDGL